ncbi:MAG: amidophosphoribosyltransferase-like protein [uncultured bacterium]|nr:MAG: amidophosphoribosyltransferase-like protein [uncultured bacterium]
MPVKKINKLILDILFPITCISCKRNGTWLCENCFFKIKKTAEQVCGICEIRITPDGRTCQNCKKKSSLDGLLTCASYKQNSVARAVHFFKYRFIADLHVPLGNLMVNVMQKTDIPLPDLILPIPLHKRRLRWRGFNQSSLLAKRISQELLPGAIISTEENILIRNRYTTPQMGIKDYKHRQQNLNGAFLIPNEELVKNKIILLVDDIATTGSTILECAKVLKNAGAKEIFAIVIARQETKQDKS